jgi:hypothetical protein
MALETKWGEPSFSPNGSSDQEEAPLTDEQEQEKKNALAYLKALCVSTRAHTKKYIPDLDKAWGYVIGDERYPSPANQAAKQMEKHLSRTVRNGMYAMMDHKVSFITDAEPRIALKTLQPISETDRRKLTSVLESELNRLEWEEDALEVSWDAEIAAVGMVMFYTRTNELTGEKEICSRVVDPGKVGVNKRATDFEDALHVTFEDTISLAEIREMWPEEGPKVKANKVSAYGVDDGEVYTEKTDDEIVTMPGNEFIVSKDGQVVEQCATVKWAWEKRPETREVWEEAKNAQPKEGWHCLYCGANYIADEPTCPDCGQEMEPVEIPEGASARQLFTRKTYPYGRCLIGIPEQNILFFDGENELPLTGVFPFAAFFCYKKARHFYGVGDYHLLKSNSKARDQNINLLRDHLRYNAHPILEHPNSAEIYNTIGNAPGSKAPVDDELCGMARFLSGGQFDYQGFIAAENALQKDAMEITGVDEILTGGGPGPESGEAQKTRMQAKSKRISGTLKRHNQFRTRYAAIVMELMQNIYTTPRSFTVKGPANELESITMTMSELPYDIIVTVTADPDQVETDRLMGQNLGQFVTSGAIFDKKLLPFMDVLLAGIGVDPWKAEVMQSKLSEFHKEQEQAPPGPPPDPAKILVAMADILKAAPTFISYEQVQEGLAAAGITPAPPEHAPLAQLQAALHQRAGQDNQPMPQALPPMAEAPPQPEPQGVANGSS